MMRSLYSGVSGLKTHQTKMDVIGNNIANVNTIAYKSQSITFSELMYQTTQAASGPNATTGTAGRNAKQIGLGVTTGAISTAITTAGSTQTTGKALDLKITGDSFFVVSDGSKNYFTRDGSFYVDAAGNLAMSSTGYNVMGWNTQTAADGTVSIKPDTVSALQVMNKENLTYGAAATTSAYVTGILDKNDENVATVAGRAINLNFYDGQGYSYTAKLAASHLDSDGTTELSDGVYYLKVSDVTDAKGATMSGASGVTLDKMYIAYSTTDGTFAGAYATKADAKTAADKKPNDYKATTAGNDITIKTSALGASFKDIGIDFSTSTNVNNNTTSTIGANKGTLKGNNTGRLIGKMSGLSISANGEIYASYTNSMTKLLGQIAVAEFANASGLQKEGDNLYSASLNSGEFDGTGVDITANSGYISTGVLEMSNVDLSTEFTEMITTQRGFQANSRIITTSDTMLEELVNLKR